MWKWLHPLANPEITFRLCSKLLPWMWAFSLLLFSIGLVWGLVFAPPDYQQGDSFRIFYVHVPTSMLSMAAYLWMAVAALVGLVWQYKLTHPFIAAIAPAGAIFTLMALFTGAVWGKPMWGTWWIWDARLTSELILFFLFLGVIALQNAFEEVEIGGKAASILSVVGVVNLPIIHYSVEWWNTLHQPATISKLGKPSISLEMLWPFIIIFLGFMGLLLTITIIRFRYEILIRYSRRPWVKQLVLKSGY